ncbi:hypothetical protein PRIPAC_74307 [Pristionchus pacificus]|uniref:Uncharacterized protein n=1 Tax=Pristionchus pacificus TaxID=54126 RepID=A0A2A6B4V5_PRIPA|nr:hypothetical protein PRIPAC_74307 [Pristionchus pacificus]|eukprot:PDM60891.1 hypothetical protein PRIPAC_54697 [Pristionchus pacificus]
MSFINSCTDSPIYTRRIVIDRDKTILTILIQLLRGRVPQVIVHITEVTAVPIYVHAVPAPLHVTTKSTMPSPLTPPGPPLY